MLQYPQETPDISVKNIQLPDDFQSHNFGYSLEKWSNKRPRLKSGTNPERKPPCHRFEEHDDNICDVTEILESLQSSSESSREEVTDNEINSDIDELWRKSEASEEKGEGRTTGDQGILVSQKRKKHKLKKTIRFSFSRPASPLTEQVIRVDVSSNISMEELNKSGSFTEDCSRGHFKIMDDEMKRNGVNGLESKSWEFEEKDVIFRCSQLALARKQS